MIYWPDELPDSTFTVDPLPISTNMLYRSGPRFKTQDYKIWIERAGWEIRAQRPEKLQRAALAARMDLPFSRKRDIDNIKPILDLTKSLGIIPDDRWVDLLLLRRVPVSEALRVSIWRL